MKSLVLALLVVIPCLAQPFHLSREEMIRYTPKNPYERFPDGRPKVPDALLERVKSMSVEEAWGILRSKGYPNQHVEGFQVLHPGQKLVGRAMTAKYLPFREDLDNVVIGEAKAEGKAPGSTQRVVDELQLNDVPVVDLMGPAEGHNFGGDNMHAAIYGATKTGAVVDGTIRDIEGTFDLPLQIYFRAPHPAAVESVTVVGINVPVEIGGAIVMPGDVVLGDRTGLIFIPPHMVEEILEYAEATQLKDEWRKEKFLTGKYKASDLYGSTAKPEATKEMDEYVKRKLEERKRGSR
jgi:regulator of RNase E activity RraA